MKFHTAGEIQSICDKYGRIILRKCNWDEKDEKKLLEVETCMTMAFLEMLQ